MYAIAKYLTVEERERACAETYTPRPELAARSIPGSRTDDLRCPIGVALARSENWMLAPPSDSAACEIMRRRNLPGRTYGEVAAAASRFISDWDNGQITDLRKAFGLEAA